MIPYLLRLFSFSLLPCFPIYAVLAIIYFSSKYYKRHTGKPNIRSLGIMWALPKYSIL